MSDGTRMFAMAIVSATLIGCADAVWRRNGDVGAARSAHWQREQRDRRTGNVSGAIGALAT